MPNRLTIRPNLFEARQVGVAGDGSQFFLTHPFVPGGSDFIALYLWDADGNFLDARIADLGSRGTHSWASRRTARKALLKELPKRDRRAISVAPFTTEHEGTEFGLVTQIFDGVMSVNAQPGDYMAFYEPWDSGEYDT